MYVKYILTTYAFVTNIPIQRNQSTVFIIIIQIHMTLNPLRQKIFESIKVNKVKIIVFNFLVIITTVSQIYAFVEFKI